MSLVNFRTLPPDGRLKGVASGSIYLPKNAKEAFIALIFLREQIFSLVKKRLYYSERLKAKPQSRIIKPLLQNANLASIKDWMLPS
jgi:hypothetical protein